MFPNSNDPWSGWIPTFLVPLITGIFILLSKIPIKTVRKKIFIIIHKGARRIVKCLSFERRAISLPINRNLKKRVFIFCGKGPFDEKFRYFEKIYTQNIYCVIDIDLSSIDTRSDKELYFYIVKIIISVISERGGYGENNLIKEFEIKWNELRDMELWKKNLSILIIDFLNIFREYYSNNKGSEKSYVVCIRNFDRITCENNKFFLLKDIINPFSRRGIIFFIDSKNDSDSNFFYPGDKNVHIEKYCQ
ncbi:MAG: hypothetical protein SD837_09270 [Candidatus Electrothrix scaldis]|nr:MAG: hypothetical protein SD837_09270 [Candidatus Electrothrix sp. GW3-3]